MAAAICTQTDGHVTTDNRVTLEIIRPRKMWPTSGRGVSNPNIKLLQIASNIPAPRKGSPTDSIFWVGQPHASPVWLAGLRLALSGDIESNPGPIVDYCRFCHIPLFHYCCRENHLCKIPKFPKSCRLCNFTFCNFCCYVSHFCLPLNRYSNPFSHSHLSSNSSRSKHSSHSTTLHNHTTTNQTRQHNSSHLTPKTTNNTFQCSINTNFNQIPIDTTKLES